MCSVSSARSGLRAFTAEKGTDSDRSGQTPEESLALLAPPQTEPHAPCPARPPVLVCRALSWAQTRVSLSPQGSLLRADMADCPSPPSSTAAPVAEPGITEQPGPRSPPPSPPGPEEPLDGANPDPDVPHPDLAPVAFFCLRQTTSPRNWCIRMVCNPYPAACGDVAGGAALGGPGLWAGVVRAWRVVERSAVAGVMFWAGAVGPQRGVRGQ